MASMQMLGYVHVKLPGRITVCFVLPCVCTRGKLLHTFAKVV